MKKVLVTGALGQIGSELVLALRERFGTENVVASDYREPESSPQRSCEPFTRIDVTSRTELSNAIETFDIGTIYHLAAILSATGEQNPQNAWRVNIDGLLNVLELGRQMDVRRIFTPSSIAVFGPETPPDAPQETVLLPRTIYGVTKVTGELLGDYYVRKYGLDVRGLRYPGIISSETLPGGGTTDYAVEIFYKALREGAYTCYVRPDTVLPMMYMPDCIKATLDLMGADRADLTHFCTFNVGAMTFSAEELATEITKHIPHFHCTYEPDYRQQIADCWPRSVDDRAARREWGWNPTFTLESMTVDMLERLRARL